jgi:peptidoglycan hydrolase-like protein with peptidoglycan-binding domain
MRRAALLCSIVSLATAPSTALARQPVAPVPPPSEQPAAPAPPPAQQPGPVAPQPVQTQMTLSVERVGGKLATVLAGDRIRVRGMVGTFVPGEQVVVRFYSSDRKLRAKRKTIVPGPDGTGTFVLAYRTQRTGKLVVRASHNATAALGALTATGREVDVIPRSIRPDARKGLIATMQRRLSRLGYVVGSKGSFDARTARAVLAFRKVAGMRRTSEASTSFMRAMADGKGSFKIRRPDHGRHVEADLTRQVIALIEGGRVRRIYPVSSGKPSTPTVVGAFRVYLKTPGTNAKGMLDSAYFIGGFATHGYPSVPIYPASHGCLRVPLPDARSLYDWIMIGTPVDVYYGPQPK